MTWRLLFSLFLAVMLAGCESPYKKSDAASKQQQKDQWGDTSFQAFLGRLRTAVSKRDMETLASMMTPDFGYRWDIPPPGDNVFAYWDENNIWPELNAILQERFGPKDSHMVAPPQFLADPEYRGYRAGIRTVGGSWKFDYFLPDDRT